MLQIRITIRPVNSKILDTAAKNLPVQPISVTDSTAVHLKQLSTIDELSNFIGYLAAVRDIFSGVLEGDFTSSIEIISSEPILLDQWTMNRILTFGATLSFSTSA